MAELYDVVVVGAGPAGSMAAKSAAQGGAKTILLERDPVIGTPVRCGEGISVRNVGRFVKIDPRWIAKEVDGMIMYSPDGSEVRVYAPDQLGVILERSLFDRHLAEMAASAGAYVQSRSDVVGLSIENEFVNGVTYTRFGKRHEIKAKVVIATDGVESRVGRWAGINTQIASSDLESAYQFFVSGIEYEHEYCHFYFGNDVAPGGYIWIFPKGERTASIGMGVEVRLCDAGAAYQKITDFIKRNFGKASIVGEMAGGVPVAPPLKKPYRNGIILAGDAARHCNPLTGGGIYTAMVSGYYAGQLAAEAVEANDYSVNYLKKFSELIHEDITIVNTRAYRIAKAVGKLTDEDFNQTARDILSIPEKERTLKNIFLKGLVSSPKVAVDIIRAFV